MKRQASRLALLVALPITLLALVPAGAAPKLTKITKCPFVITESGSYQVQKDLSCVGTAITVSADNVDLDLGGHMLSGSSQAQGGVAGIYVQGRSNVSIQNGVVQGFWNGVDFEHTVGCKITGVMAIQNGCVGIVGGDRTSGLLVTGCTATQNLCNGISLYGDSRSNNITGNATNGNRGWGISVEWGCFGNSVTWNTASQNGDRGIILLGSAGNHVEGNTCDRNGGQGIDVAGDGHDNTVTGNSATANGDAGIRLVDGSYRNTIQNNTVSGSHFGIAVAGNGGNTITGNTANLNIEGIHVFGGTCCNTITSNTALNNRDWDLVDDNGGCDANSWFGNAFQKANQDCIH